MNTFFFLWSKTQNSLLPAYFSFDDLLLRRSCSLFFSLSYQYISTKKPQVPKTSQVDNSLPPHCCQFKKQLIIRNLITWLSAHFDDDFPGSVQIFFFRFQYFVHHSREIVLQYMEKAMEKVHLWKAQRRPLSCYDQLHEELSGGVLVCFLLQKVTSENVLLYLTI